jgi:hypothetical protein
VIRGHRHSWSAQGSPGIIIWRERSQLMSGLNLLSHQGFRSANWAIDDPIEPNLHTFFMIIVAVKIRRTLEHILVVRLLSLLRGFPGFLRADRPRAGRLQGARLFGVDRFFHSLHNAALKSLVISAELYPP